jgi:predicted transcriptional regulator
VVTSKEIGLEVNVNKIKYMVMSRDKNAGRRHVIKSENSSFERVGEFKYLGTNLTYQNSIQEEIKSRLKSGNACYHSVQNLLPSSIPNNLRIRIYRIVILLLFCVGVKLGRSH